MFTLFNKFSLKCKTLELSGKRPDIPEMTTSSPGACGWTITVLVGSSGILGNVLLSAETLKIENK